MNRKEAKLLCKVYKEFYGKDPNFSKDNFRNITIEIQSMAYILNEYGVSLGAYGFVKEAYVGWDLPMSMDLQDIMINHLIGNSEIMIDDSIGLNENAKKKIEIISKEIRSVINYTSNPIESLRLISFILFIKTHAIPSATESKIIEYANCELKDLENEEKVINAINAVLDNESNLKNAKKGKKDSESYCEDMEKLISLLREIIENNEYTIVESCSQDNTLEYGNTREKMQSVRFDHLNGESFGEFLYKGIYSVEPNSVVNFMKINSFEAIPNYVFIDLNDRVEVIITNRNHKYDEFISRLQSVLETSEDVYEKQNGEISPILGKRIKPMNEK